MLWARSLYAPKVSVVVYIEKTLINTTRWALPLKGEISAECISQVSPKFKINTQQQADADKTKQRSWSSKSGQLVDVHHLSDVTRVSTHMKLRKYFYTHAAGFKISPFSSKLKQYSCLELILIARPVNVGGPRAVWYGNKERVRCSSRAAQLPVKHTHKLCTGGASACEQAESGP